MFSNDFCHHRVSKLYGNGSRKIIAFFLLRDSADHPLDARNLTVNLKYHAIAFVEQSLREIDEDGMRGNGWLVRMIIHFVVGDRKYIEKAMDIYCECRKARPRQNPLQAVSQPPAIPFSPCAD